MTELMMLRAFQREVEKQSRHALFSINLLNGANAGLINPTEDHVVARNQVWFSLQGFLIAAGNISKLMWPAPKGEASKRRVRDAQRRELRRSLGVAENSILRLSPEFRNHFEHLDQRLEEWADESVSHNMVDDMIGPTSAIVGVDPRDFLRSYDPATHTLQFRGESFEIVPVVEAINALLPKAEAEARQPHWDPPSDGTPSAAGGGQ